MTNVIFTSAQKLVNFMLGLQQAVLHANTNATISTSLKEAQLSLTNRPTLAYTDVKISLTHRSCHLVNACDLLAEFSDFYLPSPI